MIHPTHDIVSGGEFATSESGIVYVLTNCCKSDATGSDSSPTGVACRACMKPVHPSFGWAALERSFHKDYLAYCNHVAGLRADEYMAAKQAMTDHVVAAHDGNYLQAPINCPDCSRESVLAVTLKVTDIAWTAFLAARRNVFGAA